MNTYFDPSAPILFGLTGYDSGDLAARISRGGYQNLWYNPSPSPEDIGRATDANKVAKLTEDGETEALEAYLKQVANGLSYPVSWDHISINAPIHEAFKARTGSVGEGVRNRILYQILMAMQDLFTTIPDVDFEKFVDLVRKIYLIPLGLDGDISPKNIAQVREMVQSISADDDNHIINRTKRRLREKRSAYDRTIEEQYNAKMDQLTEDDPSLDLLPRIQALMVTEVSTNEEADFIKAHTNGILIAVNTHPTELDADKVDGQITDDQAGSLFKMARHFVEGASVSDLFL